VPYGTPADIARFRREIVLARIKLADPHLSRRERDHLWRIVDGTERFIERLAKDFHAEMELIDREIEAELRPGPRP